MVRTTHLARLFQTRHETVGVNQTRKHTVKIPSKNGVKPR